jgi:hypothetical protein
MAAKQSVVTFGELFCCSAVMHNFIDNAGKHRAPILDARAARRSCLRENQQPGQTLPDV